MRSARAASESLGMGDAELSALLGGQFRGYSVERLMGFLVALGKGGESVVKPPDNSLIAGEAGGRGLFSRWPRRRRFRKAPPRSTDKPTG